MTTGTPAAGQATEPDDAITAVKTNLIRCFQTYLAGHPGKPSRNKHRRASPEYAIRAQQKTAFDAELGQCHTDVDLYFFRFRWKERFISATRTNSKMKTLGVSVLTVFTLGIPDRFRRGHSKLWDHMHERFVVTDGGHTTKIRELDLTQKRAEETARNTALTADINTMNAIATKLGYGAINTQVALAATDLANMARKRIALEAMETVKLTRSALPEEIYFDQICTDATRFALSPTDKTIQNSPLTDFQNKETFQREASYIINAVTNALPDVFFNQRMLHWIRNISFAEATQPELKARFKLRQQHEKQLALRDQKTAAQITARAHYSEAADAKFPNHIFSEASAEQLAAISVNRREALRLLLRYLKKYNKNSDFKHLNADRLAIILPLIDRLLFDNTANIRTIILTTINDSIINPPGSDKIGADSFRKCLVQIAVDCGDEPDTLNHRTTLSRDTHIDVAKTLLADFNTLIRSKLTLAEPQAYEYLLPPPLSNGAAAAKRRGSSGDVAAALPTGLFARMRTGLQSISPFNGDGRRRSSVDNSSRRPSVTNVDGQETDTENDSDSPFMPRALFSISESCHGGSAAAASQQPPTSTTKIKDIHQFPKLAQQFLTTNPACQAFADTLPVNRKSTFEYIFGYLLVHFEYDAAPPYLYASKLDWNRVCVALPMLNCLFTTSTTATDSSQDAASLKDILDIFYKKMPIGTSSLKSTIKHCKTTLTATEEPFTATLASQACFHQLMQPFKIDLLCRAFVTDKAKENHQQDRLHSNLPLSFGTDLLTQPDPNGAAAVSNLMRQPTAPTWQATQTAIDCSKDELAQALFALASIFQNNFAGQDICIQDVALNLFADLLTGNTHHHQTYLHNLNLLTAAQQNAVQLLKTIIAFAHSHNIFAHAKQAYTSGKFTTWLEAQSLRAVKIDDLAINENSITNVRNNANADNIADFVINQVLNPEKAPSIVWSWSPARIHNTQTTAAATPPPLTKKL